eukprot:1404130-Pyramimonas_sp.AAC.1
MHSTPQRPFICRCPYIAAIYVARDVDTLVERPCQLRWTLVEPAACGRGSTDLSRDWPPLSCPVRNPARVPRAQFVSQSNERM